MLTLAALATPAVYLWIERAVYDFGCEGLGFGCSPDRGIAAFVGCVLYLGTLGASALVARRLGSARSRLVAAGAGACVAVLAASAPVGESRWPYWTAPPLEDGARQAAALAASLRTAAAAGAAHDALSRLASAEVRCLDNRTRDTGTAVVSLEGKAAGDLGLSELDRLAGELRRQGYDVSPSGAREVPRLYASAPNGRVNVRIEEIGSDVRAWIGTRCLKR